MNRDSRTHMREHWEERHEKDRGKLETTEDIMKVYEVMILERYRSALEKQIEESIHIRKATGQILNDTQEFTRCELLQFSVGKQRQKTVTTEDENMRDTEHRRKRQRRQMSNIVPDTPNKGKLRLKFSLSQSSHINQEAWLRPYFS